MVHRFFLVYIETKKGKAKTTGENPVKLSKSAISSDQSVKPSTNWLSRRVLKVEIRHLVPPPVVRMVRHVLMVAGAGALFYW